MHVPPSLHVLVERDEKKRGNNPPHPNPLLKEREPGTNSPSLKEKGLGDEVVAIFLALTYAYWIYGPLFPSNASALSQSNVTSFSLSCARYEYLIAATVIAWISSFDNDFSPVRHFSSRI